MASWSANAEMPPTAPPVAGCPRHHRRRRRRPPAGPGEAEFSLEGAHVVAWTVALQRWTPGRDLLPRMTSWNTNQPPRATAVRCRRRSHPGSPGRAERSGPATASSAGGRDSVQGAAGRPGVRQRRTGRPGTADDVSPRTLAEWLSNSGKWSLASNMRFDHFFPDDPGYRHSLSVRIDMPLPSARREDLQDNPFQGKPRMVAPPG